MKKYLYRLLALTLFGGLIACSSDNGNEPEPGPTPPEPTQAQFAIEIAEVTAASVTLTVTPENPETTFYYDIATRSDFDAYGGDVTRFVGELLDFLTSTTGQSLAEAVRSLQKQGSQSETIQGLPPATDFVAFAVGLDDEGNCSTEAVTKEFTTLEGGAPSDCTFTFAYPSVLAQSAFVTVTPSDPTIRYFYISLPREEAYSDEELTAEILQTMLQISADYGATLADVIQTLTYTGTLETLEEELTPETEYVSYAYAINATTGQPEGDVYRGEFTTATTGTGTDFSVRATNIRWFKGSDLAELDSKYEAIRDGAYLLADIVTEGSPKEWYIALSAGDRTNVEEFPDDSVITALMMSGTTPNKTSMQVAVQYGDATFLGFAMDSYGQSSAIYREKVEITEQGATSVDEFPGTLSTYTSLEKPLMPSLSQWLDPTPLNRSSLSSILSHRFDGDK